jgi:putative transcriptional regulator
LKAGDDMPLIYKIDVIIALKEKGYNTNILRKEKLLAEGVIQALREKKSISWVNISRICALLECQPGDILEYVPDEQ